ncbi:glycosyltransferase family 39 protein [Ferrovibrio sp.]|uniref:glycosyltransferase family 39 protein n=1 Tax=Ferrovibrio sp. TaxID=1917215 RepID=UPI003D12846D
MPQRHHPLLIAGLILLQTTSWVLVPYFTLPNAPLDVIEGAVWGRQFELGYHKGPPLFAWALGLGLQLLPGSMLPALLLSQFSLGLAYWAVWRVARRLYGDDDALIVLLLMTTIYFYGFPSPEFNPIILQMAFSAIAGSFFYTALRDDRLRDWVIVGIAAGLGLLTRYSTAMYLVAMAVFVLLQPQARLCLKRPGPYLAAVITLLIMLPHLYWLQNHNFVSFAYVDQRAGFSRGWNRVLLPVHFIGSQFLALLPPLVLLLIGLGARSEPVVTAPRDNRFEKWFVIAIALGPVLLVVMLALIMGRTPRAMWGAPLWIFATLLVPLLFSDKLSATGRRWVARAWPVMFLLPLALYASAMVVGPQVMNRNKRVHFPGQELARTVTDTWRRETGQPLRFVAGQMWLTGNVVFYSSDRPQSFTAASRIAAPWIDNARLRQCGAMLLWPIALDEDEIPHNLAAAFPDARLLPPLVLKPPPNALQHLPFRFGWAIAQPAPGAAACPERR